MQVCKMELKPNMAPTLKQTSRAQSVANSGNQVIDCAGCHQVIRERYMLKAVDQMWHEDCLKCSCCECRLGEVGSTLFYKADLILCKRDYLRLFGNTGHCSACNNTIPAFEMVMRAKTNVYHLECFACQQCNHRFCVGDKFYLCNDKILCEYDYEERLVFANMSYNYNSYAHIKRHTQNLQSSKNVYQHQNNISVALPPTSSVGTSTMQHHESVNSTTPNQNNLASHNGPVILPNNQMASPVGGGAAINSQSQSDDTSSGYGSPESPMFDRK